MTNKLYFCSGCSRVHYDKDYLKEDGDLLIDDWESFLESVIVIDKRKLEKKK